MTEHRAKPPNVIGPHPSPEMYRAGWEIDCQCARCGSSVMSERCDQCEDGYDHECHDDGCEFVTCRECNGKGVFHTCCSSAEFCNAYPTPGREHIKRGQIEWFVFEERPTQ